MPQNKSDVAGGFSESDNENSNKNDNKEYLSKSEEEDEAQEVCDTNTFKYVFLESNKKKKRVYVKIVT